MRYAERAKIRYDAVDRNYYDAINFDYPSYYSGQNLPAVNPVKKVSHVDGFRPPTATDFLTSDFIEGFLLTG